METQMSNGPTAVPERSVIAVAEHTSCSCLDRGPELGSPDPQLPDPGSPILHSTDPDNGNTDTQSHISSDPGLSSDPGFLHPKTRDNSPNLVFPNSSCPNPDNKDLRSVDCVSPDSSSSWLSLPTQSLSVIGEKQGLHLPGSATETPPTMLSGTESVSLLPVGGSYVPRTSLVEELAPVPLETSRDSHHCVATADPGSLVMELRKATDQISLLQNTLKEKEEDVKNLTNYQEQLRTENAGLRQKVAEIENQRKLTLMDDVGEWFSRIFNVIRTGCRSAASPDTRPQPIIDQLTTSSNYYLWESSTRDRVREEEPSSLPHGLPNLGNTCYMAAVLQCLYHMYEFRAYFTHGLYRKDLADKSLESRVLVEAFASMLEALENKSHDIGTICRRFKAALETYDKQFLGDRQQEAHDFLGVLLTGLHDSLLNVEDPARHLEGSLVSELFQGVQESVITCSKKYVQLCATKEPFFSLSLSVSGDSNLKDLLERHLQNRSLEWDCDACGGTSHVCQHSVLIRCLPVYLIIHLNRYTEDAQLGHKSLVSYQDTLKVPSHPDAHTNKVITYHLMAVCQHLGSATQGHYVASCKKYDKEEWYLHEDSTVTYQGSLHCPTHNAHILFYKAKTEETERETSDGESFVIIK